MGLTAVDFAEIRRLDARYCHTVDFGDFDGVVACFAPDGAFEIASNPSYTRRGEKELRQSIAVRDGKGHVRHTTLGSMIDGDGVTARSLTSVLITFDLGPPAGKGQVTQSGIYGTGFYVDDLVKIDGRWVYATRCFSGDGGADMLERFTKPLDIEPVDAGETGPGMSDLDYEAIRQLLTRCGYMLDFEDYDGFAACFTADGSLHEVTRPDGHPETRLTARGRQELWQYAVYVGDIGYHGHVRNSAISAVIDGDGKRARVSSYAFITQDYGPPAHPRQHGHAAVYMTGIYRDEVVKVDGRWLLSKRTFRRDTQPEVLTLVGRPVGLELFDDDVARTRPARRSNMNGGNTGQEEIGVATSDLEGIRQLLARYSQTFDFGDAEGFVSCFAKDGVLDTSAPQDGLTGIHQGHEALRTFVSASTEYSAGLVRNSALNLLVDTEGSTARATSYAVVTRAYADVTNSHGKPGQVTCSALETTGMFFDELVKVDGRWLFSRRVFRHDGLPDVLERVQKPLTLGPR